MSNEKTEAESVAQIVRAAQQSIKITDAAKTDILVFPDKSIVPLEPYSETPRRKRASVSLMDAASFSRYVNEHAEPGTALFGKADMVGGKFVAVIDYHQPNNDLLLPGAAAIDGSPGWGSHRAGFALANTPEWARWIERNNKALTQTEFAEFLEDNLPDVLEPAGIVMLEIAQTLAAKTEVGFSSAIRLNNGQHQLTYVENIASQAGVEGNLQIPERFKIALAPFVGSSKYEIQARLRYRLARSKIEFTFQLERPHKVVEAAFKDIREGIETVTGKVVLLGELNSMS